ncbi:MAG: hypothetical protein JNK74_25350 [Candidatus Hydrogenedentes bacterium]|nr:hypothetical protein [Candidatus Hydrogenedentota bacterium]
MQQDIQLPGEVNRYRALADDGMIRFEPLEIPTLLRHFGSLVVVLLALLPLAVYAALALGLHRAGESLPWGVHGLGAGFGLLCAVALGYHAWDNHRFRSCTVLRRDNGTLEMRYARTGGRVKIYTVEEPARLMAVLRQESGGTTGWRRIRDESGATRRERFADHVSIGLYIKGASTSPRMVFQPRGWLQLLPDELDLHHKRYEPEKNLAATIAALRPLAQEFEQSLGLPARYHVADRGAVHLDTVHGEAPGILNDGE